MKKAFFSRKGLRMGRVLVSVLLILGPLCFTSVLFGRTSGTYSPVLPESSSCSYCSSSSSPDSSDYEPGEESQIRLFEVTDRPARRLRRGVLEVAVEFPARIQRVFAAERGADQGADGKDLTSFWQLADSPDIVLSAKLNGDEVGDAFRKVSDQSARAELSASYGLKHGRNRLVLEARTQDGRFSREKLKFFVPDDVPLVAAGVDQRVAVGRPVRLEGSISFSATEMGHGRRKGHWRRKWHGRRKNKLVYRWRVTNAPLASLRARLIDAKRAGATFHPDVPGRYELELRISGRGLKSPATDSLTVTVSPQAMVPFQTVLADDGSPEGVWVAVDRTTCGTTLDQGLSQPCWYEAGGSVEVLVLDRTSLEPVSKKSYSTLNGDELQSQIGDLDDGEDLVIIVSRADLVNPDSTLVTQLQGIGVDIASGGYLEGPFSIVGIPGSIQGKAYLNTGLTIGGQQAGELSGFLKHPVTISTGGNIDITQFVLALSDVYAYDTRSDASTTDTNVVQIGDSTAKALTDKGGLQVVTFDALNLEILTNEVYHGADDGVTGISWTDMGTRLRRALDEGNDFVIVSLVPNGGSSTLTSGYPSEWESAGLYNMVLPAIERAGGNPDIFLRAVNENKTYSFIGSPGAGGVGYESSAVFYDGLSADDQQKLPGMAGALSGALGRGFDTRLYPTAGDPNGLQQPQLSPILYQPLSAWPMTPALDADSATGEEVALAYIAQNALGVDCNDLSEPTCTEPTVSIDSTQGVRQVALDLRANYPSSWTGSSTEVNELDCDDADFSGTANPQTTSSDCVSAQVQLVGELADRSAVTNWFTALEQPFVDTQGETVTNLQQIGKIVQICVLEQEVDDLLKAASAGWRSNLFTSALSSLAGITEFLGEFTSPELGTVGSILGLMAEGGEFADTVSEGPSTEVESFFLLESELNYDEIEIDTQVENAVQLQMKGQALSQLAVLSDWGKMSQVATKSDEAYDEGGWEITTQDTTTMENAVNYTVRQQTYRAWMQDLYAAVQVNFYSALSYTPYNAATWECLSCGSSSHRTIFEDATDKGDSQIEGFGDAQQYWPQTSILTSGETAVANYAYVMYQQAWHKPGTPTSGHDAELAPSDIIKDLFDQPSADSCPSPAGFVPPLYWPQTFDMTELVSCPTCEGGDTDDYQWTTGSYYEVYRNPLSFCTTVISNDSPVGERCTLTSASGTNLKPIDLAALVNDINQHTLGQGLGVQVTDDSVVMIEAYGGKGHEGDKSGSSGCAAGGGDGGQPGYARTISTVGTLGSSMLYAYPGEEGSEYGWGGSATLVSTSELVWLSNAYDLSSIGPDDATGVAGILAIAGGGGGGGKGHCISGSTSEDGRKGGDGGQAIANSTSYAVGAGTEGSGDSPGHGGSDGVGGSGHPGGSNGVGGPGGIVASSQEVGGGVLWNGWYWADNPRYTGGGWPWGAGGSNGEHGGAGGGGFGGGGAAEGSGVNHIGGGGGGGSLAAEPKREYGEDSPLFQGPTPPSDFDGAGGVVLTFQLQ